MQHHMELGHPVGSSPNAGAAHQAVGANAPSTAANATAKSSVRATYDVRHGASDDRGPHATPYDSSSMEPAASDPSQAPAAKAQSATATMDPNIPSSESAPTALPTNPATHPDDQKQAVKDEHPAVVAREVEKTKGEEREFKGEKPEGTIVAGLEDDRLFTMLRRFDRVRRYTTHIMGERYR